MMINDFFTPQEFKNILINATWSDENCPDDRTIWVRQLNEITNYLVSVKTSRDTPDVFVPFLDFVKARVFREIRQSGICTEDIFERTAFEGYRRGITDFMVSSWSEIGNKILNRQKEAKNFSDEDCCRYICSGRHFHDCAVEYPLYARLLAEYVFTVISEAVTIIKRVSFHRENIYRRFGNAHADTVPRIVCVSKPLSDRHNGGQTVHLLTFEDNCRVLYKPRQLKAEKAFSDWLSYLCMTASKEPFMTADVLDCGEYGFVRYIEPYSFQTPEEVAAFFYREGFLLGGVYLLQGSDIHAENIIASRDPVVIDAECIFKVGRSNSKAFYTVVSTAILPGCITHPAYYAYTSAACDTENGTFNLPQYKGKYVSAYNHYEVFIRGFEDCLLAAVRNFEKSSKKVRDIFLGVPARTLPLSTFAYAFLLRAICKPERLSGANIAEKSIAVLTKRNVSDNISIPNLEISERTAIKRLDIPYVTMNIGTQEVENIQKHILSVDGQDIDQQKKYISFLLGPAVFPKNQLKLCKAEYDDMTLIHDLVQDVYKGIETVFGIVVPRKEKRPYICQSENNFAEGKLGAVVALAVYLKCYGTSAEESILYSSAIEKFLKKLKSIPDFSKTFSSSEPGFAEGMGGTLILACLLYDLGVLEREIFEKFAEEIAFSVQKSLAEKRFFTFFHSFLYHQDGLCFALQRAAVQKGITEQLGLRLTEVSKELSKVINYSENDAEERLRRELQEAFERYDSLAVSQMAGQPFIGFFFGTGGKLFRLCLAYSAEYSPDENKTPREFSFWQKLLNIG